MNVFTLSPSAATAHDTYSQIANEALGNIEAWMDRQPLSRTGQPQETQDKLAKLAIQAQVMNGVVDSRRSARNLQDQHNTFTCVCQRHGLVTALRNCHISVQQQFCFILPPSSATLAVHGGFPVS